METTYEKNISNLLQDKYIIYTLELSNSKIKYSYEYISIGGDITDYNINLISNTLNPSIKLVLENTTNVMYGFLINIIIWDDNISDYRYSRFTVDYTLPKQEKDTFIIEEFVTNDSSSIIITLDSLDNGRDYDDDDIKIYIKTYNYETDEYSNDFINIGNISTIALIEKTQIKFGNYIEPIQLGSQYMKVKELKDIDKMLIDIKENVWQDFFINEAKKLSIKIIK